jgi:excisionase family DNA binding protein
MQEAMVGGVQAKRRKRRPRKQGVVVPPNWRTLTTLTIDQTAVLLDLGRNQAYAAAHRNELPVVKVGKIFRVSVPRLVRMIDGEAA